MQLGEVGKHVVQRPVRLGKSFCCELWRLNLNAGCKTDSIYLDLTVVVLPKVSENDHFVLGHFCLAILDIKSL